MAPACPHPWGTSTCAWSPGHSIGRFPGFWGHRPHGTARHRLSDSCHQPGPRALRDQTSPCLPPPPHTRSVSSTRLTLLCLSASQQPGELRRWSGIPRECSLALVLGISERHFVHGTQEVQSQESQGDLSRSGLPGSQWVQPVNPPRCFISWGRGLPSIMRPSHKMTDQLARAASRGPHPAAGEGPFLES